MLDLAQHIEETAFRLDGWETGTLVFDEPGVAFLMDPETRQEKPVNIGSHVVEVETVQGWHRMKQSDYERISTDGTLLFAGARCRMK
ncbi:hypothetical protein [Anoxynatronum sibiricum]|uniref:Uncharacterized protein n=1 Tax=Anoxynatronum sibiricum TaxID=210623 RepID=A0ABU9VWC6_9CLOT